MNIILERGLLETWQQSAVIDMSIENDDDLFVISDAKGLKLENQPTLCLCSLPMSRDILKSGAYPGVYCDLHLMKCSSYYPKYGNLLLNEESCIFLPYGLLSSHLKDIFKDLDEVFVRPDSGFKTFTGMILNKENYELELSLIKEHVDDDTMCVVANSCRKSIINEYRMFVCGNEVVSGSSYIENGKINSRELSRSIDNKYYDFANEVVKIYSPERCFSLDIVELTNQDLYLLEVNSFSCAGFYRSNVAEILKKARVQAILDWEDVYK